MLRFRKIAVVCALSLSLVLSSATAFADSLEDTVGLTSEISINKLVSLGVFGSSGANFNPEAQLTRGEFALVLNKIMTLSTPKTVKIKDVSTKNGANAPVAKVVGNGLMKLDGKGNFNAGKGITYAEFSRALASGLGLKLTWTDRPIDFLYYLDRKGVLDIDTDLDAVVTKEAAAVAIDQYVTLKNLYKSDSGVVSELKTDSIVINNGSTYVTYKVASNAALFVSGQNQEITSFGAGTAVEVLLNSKGEIAFMSGSSLTLEEGTIVYKDGKASVNDVLRNIDLNAVLVPLPNRPTGTFTLSNFGGYSAAGVTFGGGAYVNNSNDEVTMLELYIAKAEGKPFRVIGSTITIDFSGDALADQPFSVAADAKIALESAPEAALTLSELGSMQIGNTLTGTIEINADGDVTAIKATATPKEPTE